MPVYSINYTQMNILNKLWGSSIKVTNGVYNSIVYLFNIHKISERRHHHKTLSDAFSHMFATIVYILMVHIYFITLTQQNTIKRFKCITTQTSSGSVMVYYVCGLERFLLKEEIR